MPKGRILIVDDEPVIAESLSELLEGWGYETAVASDGLAGLAKVEEFRPSVVVSDVYMPKLDGFGLLRAWPEPRVRWALECLYWAGVIQIPEEPWWALLESANKKTHRFDEPAARRFFPEL